MKFLLHHKLFANMTVPTRVNGMFTAQCICTCLLHYNILAYGEMIWREKKYQQTKLYDLRQWYLMKRVQNILYKKSILDYGMFILSMRCVCIIRRTAAHLLPDTNVTWYPSC